MCMFIAWGEIQEKSFNEQEENNLHSLFCMNIRKSSLSAVLWVNPGTAQVMFLLYRAAFWWYGRKGLAVKTISTFEDEKCYGNSGQ